MPMVDALLPSQDRSRRRYAVREEARSRLAATSSAVQTLEALLDGEPGLPTEIAEALVAAARALFPVAIATGTTLTVSAGPADEWAVQVSSDASGPQARLDRRRPPENPDTSSSDRADTWFTRPETSRRNVAGQLANLLRSGTGSAR
jgi:hypothetical protein